MYWLIVLFEAFFANQAGCTKVNKCKHNAGDLPKVNIIKGCNIPPCEMQQLQGTDLFVIFEAPRRMKTMRTLATLLMRVNNRTVPKPYNLYNVETTCNYLDNAECPVEAGWVLEHSTSIYIEEYVPVNIVVKFEYRVVDESDNPVYCFSVPVIIRSYAIASYEITYK